MYNHKRSEIYAKHRKLLTVCHMYVEDVCIDMQMKLTLAINVKCALKFAVNNLMVC